MKRYHITLGASTTTGGKVISASSACSINGIKVAVEGEQVSCPACKATGTIRIFGARIPESWNGKQVALQDDLCVCRCSSPPRLVANQNLKYQNLHHTGDSGATDTPEQAASNVRQQIQQDALTSSDEMIVLRLLDEYSQHPLANRRYRLEFPGNAIEGHTDYQGYTAPFDSAKRDQLIAWQILD